MMPKFSSIEVSISPQEFVAACDRADLLELDSIMKRPSVRERLNHPKLFDKNQLDLMDEIKSQTAAG